jgi:hypothetical protein
MRYIWACPPTNQSRCKKISKFSYSKFQKFQNYKINQKISNISKKFKRGRGAKVQNWPHIILKNNA